MKLVFLFVVGHLLLRTPDRGDHHICACTMKTRVQSAQNYEGGNNGRVEVCKGDTSAMLLCAHHPSTVSGPHPAALPRHRRHPPVPGRVHKRACSPRRRSEAGPIPAAPRWHSCRSTSVSLSFAHLRLGTRRGRRIFPSQSTCDSTR